MHRRRREEPDISRRIGGKRLCLLLAISQKLPAVVQRLKFAANDIIFGI